MKRFYQFSLLMLALLLPALALAHDFEVDGIYYNINGNEATVTYEGTDDYGHNTYTGNVTIPAKVTYNGITFSVTCIGDSAFAGCNALASIVIPNSVTSIGDYAFDCCSSLTSIEIPNSITSIGTCAFFGCGLTSIEIPNSVTSIGSGAFNACPVTSITVACDNPSYDSRDTCNAIIETATNILIAGCRNTVIPNSVTSIGDYAFGYCDLTSIEIPNSVTSIGTSAFSGCGLTSIEIPNSVTSIGTSAFSGCGLTSVTLPNSVTSIGDYAFDYCSSLTSIEIPNSVTSIGNHAFYSCKSLTSIDIPNSVTSIGDRAFSYCSGLNSVIFGNMVTIIGESAFSECSKLTSIDIPNSVTTIKRYAFTGCNALASIVIPNSVTTIGSSAFSSTAWYRNQPDGLVYAGMVAYDYKGSMPSGTSIYLKEGTVGIADFAFYDCDGLTCITIPNSVNTIGNQAFYHCNGLASVVIPNSVTTIGNQAFEGTLWYNNQPEGLVYAGLVAYKYKGEMPEKTNITLREGTVSISYGAFRDCTRLTSVIIPNSVTTISNYAFSGCSGLTSVGIPNSLTNIGQFAFYNCTGLTDVYSYITDLSKVSMESLVFYLSNSADYANRTLHVLYGMSSAYQADNKWSQYFSNIVEMESETILATSVELDYESVELIESGTLQMTASVLPDNATDKTVTWASSDETIATVDVNGLVTAISHGTATITATTADGSDLSASCVINVKSPITPPTVENQFIVSDISAKHGDVVVIPISLINNQTFAAFQTDVFLPKGFSIATDEDDEYIVTASERLTNDHVLMTNDANNGSVRILCYTPNALPISGNEGELFYITIQVPNNAEGLYTITLRNSLMTTTEYQEIGIPDAEGQMEIYSFIPGDVNDSRTVTVTDIVVTAQHVLDMNPSPFIFEAADMNSDGNVTVTDIMLIAYLINHPTMNAPRRMLSLMNVGDRMNGEDVTLMAGETHTVSIALDNISDYTAFQLDLTLPEGLTASNFQLTDRACSHALDVNTLSNGKTRVLCYSPAIETISGHEGALLTFDVTATSEIEGIITVDGIEMVIADCQTALLDAFTIDVNTTTSVNDIPGAKAVLRMDYFNLAGQQIDRPDSGVTLVVTTYTDGTRTTTKVMK